MKTCPHCTLISPDTATHCDCGFDFTSSPAEVKAELKTREWDAAWGVPIGLVVLGVAVAVSVRTLAVYWGLAFTGAGIVLGSIKRCAQFRDAERAIKDEAARRPNRFRPR